MTVVHIPPGTYRIETMAYPLRLLTQHIGTPPLITAPPDFGLDQIWNLQYVDVAKSIFTLQSAVPQSRPIPNRLQALETCSPGLYRIALVHPPDIEAVAYTAEGPETGWEVEFRIISSNPAQKWRFIPLSDSKA